MGDTKVDSGVGVTVGVVSGVHAGDDHAGLLATGAQVGDASVGDAEPQLKPME